MTNKMNKLQSYLKNKGIEPSLKNYGVNALNAMAVGLFGSLIIGLVLKNIGKWLAISSLITYGEMAQKATGAAIAVAIAYALKAPLLVLVASVAVGIAANDWGGVMGTFIGTLIAVECGKLVSKSTTIDILVTPAVTLIVGFSFAYWLGKPIAYLMNEIGIFIENSTHYQPFIMSILVAVVMGMLLTLPISSAAIAISLSLSGDAAGAATIGCCAQMIGFAVMSKKDNTWGTVLGIGLGTSMLQIPNIIKNPKILLPPIITSILIAPIATLYFHMQNIPSGAGMGTSGLVGQIGTIDAMGNSTPVWIAIAILHFIAPALLCYLIYRLLLKIQWIKKGDLKLEV